MRRALFGLLAAAIGFCVFYLCGAFVQASFDISAWSMDARMTVAIFGTGAGVFALAAAEGLL